MEKGHKRTCVLNVLEHCMFVCDSVLSEHSLFQLWFWAMINVCVWNRLDYQKNKRTALLNTNCQGHILIHWNTHTHLHCICRCRVHQWRRLWLRLHALDLKLEFICICANISISIPHTVYQNHTPMKSIWRAIPSAVLYMYV